MRVLTAVPVYNEERYVEAVLHEVRRYSQHILVVNDGSTDRTPEKLAGEVGIEIITHAKNRGYGAALVSAFDYTLRHDYDVLVTMDCDGQHEPSRIAVLLEAIHDADIVSGSRYLRDFRQDSVAPHDRRRRISLPAKAIISTFGWRNAAWEPNTSSTKSRVVLTFLSAKSAPRASKTVTPSLGRWCRRPSAPKVGSPSWMVMTSVC